MRVVTRSFAFAVLILSAQGCSSDPTTDAQPSPSQPIGLAAKTNGEIDFALLFRAGSPEWLDGYAKRLDECFSQVPKGITLDLRLFQSPRPILINSPRRREALDSARLQTFREELGRRGYEVRRSRIEGSVEADGRPPTNRIEFASVSPVELAVVNPARIDLGVSLFVSGSERFASGGRETVDEKTREIPRGTTVDVEVFRQPSGGLMINRFRPADEADRARGHAVRNRLRSLGFNARDVIVRGVAEENGRPSSRRVELVLAEIERDSAWGKSISAPPDRERIDFGVKLFNAGSEAFADGGVESIDEMIKGLPRGAVVDLEVFQDSGRWHNRRRTREELSLARGNAVKEHLRVRGIVVRTILVRGAVAYGGRAPSRRVEIVVVSR